nr:hypothetical protein BaRGS_007851 [Batillaria attramentaria]
MFKGEKTREIWPAFLDDKWAVLPYCLFARYGAAYIGTLIGKRGSYVIMCLASTERLYAITRPLHVKTFFLSRRPILCVCGVYVSLAVWHIYFLTRADIRMVEVKATGSTACRAVRTEFYYQHQQVNDGFGMAAKVILTYVALLLQLVLNGLTVWALRRHNNVVNSAKSLSAGEERKRMQERQLTVTLLGASVSYVILSVPSAIVNLCQTVIPEFHLFGVYANIFTVVSDIGVTLNYLGCAVDFFSYCLLSSKYRKTLFGMIWCKRGTSSASAKNSLTIV